MKRTLIITGKRYEIMPAGDLKPSDKPMKFADKSEALTFLRRCIGNSSNMAVVRAVLKDAGTRAVMTKMADAFIVEELAAKVAAGKIKVLETVTQHLIAKHRKKPPPPPPPKKPPPPPPPKPSRPAPPPPPKATIVEFVEVVSKSGKWETVTRTAQDGAFRQFINLGKDLEGPAKRNAEYGVYVHLRAKLEWTDKSKKDPFTGWKVKFTAVLDKGANRPNDLDTAARKWGFLEEGGHDTNDQLAGDDGWTNPLAFYFSQYGGDKFTIKAQAIDPDTQKSVSEKQLASPFQVWRRFWYQITRDENTNVSAPALARAAYKKVFAEIVTADEVTFKKSDVSKPDRTYYPEWMIKTGGGTSEKALIGEHNKQEFYKKYNAEKDKPVKAHVVVCDGQWDPVPVAAKVSFKTNKNPSGPVKVKLKGGSPGIVKPALKGNLVKKGTWAYLGAKSKKGKLKDDDILIEQSRSGLAYVKVKVPDDTLDLTAAKVKIDLELYYGASFCGESVGYQILCIAGPDDEFSPTLTHEIGHAFHQTPADGEQPAGLPKHPKQYDDDHGGTGSHCSTGGALNADDEYENGTCVMFHEENSVCTNEFCAACDPYLKAQDMAVLIAPPKKKWYQEFWSWLTGG